jgi:hypothetical protein
VIPWLLLAATDPGEIRVSSRAYVARPAALRVETNLVEVGVVMRNGAGHAIAGLTKENFLIHDNGRERAIADFAVEQAEGDAKSKEAVRPRFIALYFDDINSKDEQHANDLKQTREAVEKRRTAEYFSRTPLAI